MPAPERGRWTWWQSPRGKLLGAVLVGILAAGLSLAGSQLPHPATPISPISGRARARSSTARTPTPRCARCTPMWRCTTRCRRCCSALPLGLLRQTTAEAVFVGVGMAALAYAGLSIRLTLLIACASAAALVNVAMGQWSPLLTASAVLPNLGFVLAAKPSIGLVIAAGYLTRRALVLAVALTVREPGGVAGVAARVAAERPRRIHVSPLLRPGGVLLLLALVRWRRPEARMLATFACVPQTGDVVRGVAAGADPADPDPRPMRSSFSPMSPRSPGTGGRPRCRRGGREPGRPGPISSPWSTCRCSSWCFSAATRRPTAEASR